MYYLASFLAYAYPENPRGQGPGDVARLTP